MKIYFNRKIRRSPWGGGAHFMSAMADYLIEKGHQVVEKLERDVNLIFMMDARYEEEGCDVNMVKGYRILNPKVKILYRINECDARKGTNDVDKLILESTNVASRVVFISEWLKQYFTSKGFSKESDVVYNGCNSEWFKPDLKKTELSNPIRLVTHHWSDNWMKGFDLYNALDELVGQNTKYQFTYIGRYNKDYSPKNIKVIPPLYGADLGDELRKHDIYVTSSKFEPCGMHHIEGASSGLPVIYHKDGGAIVDMCKKHGEQFSDSASFALALEKITSNYSNYRSLIDYESLSMKRCCDEYYKIILDLTK